MKNNVSHESASAYINMINIFQSIYIVYGIYIYELGQF